MFKVAILDWHGKTREIECASKREATFYADVYPDRVLWIEDPAGKHVLPDAVACTDSEY